MTYRARAYSIANLIMVPSIEVAIDLYTLVASFLYDLYSTEWLVGWACCLCFNVFKLLDWLTFWYACDTGLRVYIAPVSV